LSVSHSFHYQDIDLFIRAADRGVVIVSLECSRAAAAALGATNRLVNQQHSSVRSYLAYLWWFYSDPRE